MKQTIYALFLMLPVTGIAFANIEYLPPAGISCTTDFGHQASIIREKNKLLHFLITDASLKTLDDSTYDFDEPQGPAVDGHSHNLDSDVVQITIKGLEINNLTNINVVYFHQLDDLLLVLKNCKPFSSMMNLKNQ